MVHFTDTRAQKVVSYTSARYTIGACTWPTLKGANHFIIITTVLSFTRAQKMDSHTEAHYLIGVSTSPAMRRAKHFASTSYFFYAWTVHIIHIFFTTQNQYWWDANNETIHQQLGYCIWSPSYRIIELLRKMKICKKRQTFESIK